MSDIEGDSYFLSNFDTSEDELEFEPFIQEERMKNKNYLGLYLFIYSSRQP